MQPLLEQKKKRQQYKFLIKKEIKSAITFCVLQHF